MDRDQAQVTTRSYWVHGNVERVATALTGLIAVLVALQAASWSPGGEAFILQNESVRMAAFASLTIWATLTMGLHRRGAAAMLAMVFASFLELVILPFGPETARTLAAGTAGIILSFLALQFYWYRVQYGDERPG